MKPGDHVRHGKQVWVHIIERIGEWDSTFQKRCSLYDSWNYMSNATIVDEPVNCLLCIGATPP